MIIVFKSTAYIKMMLWMATYGSGYSKRNTLTSRANAFSCHYLHANEIHADDKHLMH